MCPAHIAFSTPKEVKLTWTDTFERVEKAELEKLIVECRYALHSLEAELEAREAPKEDTKLGNCFAKLQERVWNINNQGVLSTMDIRSLEEAGIFLGSLRSGYINSSQIRSSRKDGQIYKQLLWLISRVVGPIYALLLVYSVIRTDVERLNSIQRVSLVRYMARHCDLLSSRVLEEKGYELGLCKTNPSLLERTSGKRKRLRSKHTAPSTTWTDPNSISHHKSSPWTICDIYRQNEQAGATILTCDHPAEVNGVSPPETGFNSGILTPVSDAANDDDTNGNSALRGNIIDYGAVEP
ncbi:MAG: hypothetical protein Q9217_005592 [Psora testacea]